jgi:hypothetical protein
VLVFGQKIACHWLWNVVLRLGLTAWQAFYHMPPSQCAIYIARALEFLTVLGEAADDAQETTKESMA